MVDMTIDDCKVGMNCHLVEQGNKIFVNIKIKDQALPIGVALFGQTQIRYYAQPIALLPITVSGHTNN